MVDILRVIPVILMFCVGIRLFGYACSKNLREYWESKTYYGQNQKRYLYLAFFGGVVTVLGPMAVAFVIDIFTPGGKSADAAAVLLTLFAMLLVLSDVEIYFPRIGGSRNWR